MAAHKFNPLEPLFVGRICYYYSMDGSAQRGPEARVAVNPVDVQQAPQGFAKKLLGRFRFRAKQEVPQIQENLPAPEVKPAPQAVVEVREVNPREITQELAAVREELGDKTESESIPEVEALLHPHPDLDTSIPGVGETEVEYAEQRRQPETPSLVELQKAVAQELGDDPAKRKEREQVVCARLPILTEGALPEGFGFESTEETALMYQLNAVETITGTLGKMVKKNPELRAIATGPFDEFGGVARRGFTLTGGDMNAQMDDSRFPQFGTGVIASIPLRSLTALADEQVVTVKLDESAPGQELVIMPNPNKDASKQFLDNLSVWRLPKGKGPQREIAQQISAKAIPPQL